MRRITCCIVDDEPNSTLDLELGIKKIPELDLKWLCSEPKNALVKLKSDPVDLVFLDLTMDVLPGLDFIKMTDSKVIFTTADKGSYEEALDNENALDYLIKPVRFDRLLKAVRKAEAHFPNFASLEVSGGYEIRTALGTITVPFEKINYIKSGDYFRDVHWEGGVGQVTLPLAEIEKEFPSEVFARVHKSYIVNRAKVVRTKYDQLILKNGEVIPLGLTYKQNLLSV